MASNNDGDSEDWHTATGDSSKKSVSPWEMMESEEVVGGKKPPAVPPTNSSASAKPPLVAGNTARASSETSVYIRADGKKVRRVKKHGRKKSATSIASSDEEETVGSRSTMGSSGSGAVYIRADGKKVRLVKRLSKKPKGEEIDRDIPVQVSITSPTSGDCAPTYSTSNEDEKGDDGARHDAIESDDSLQEKSEEEMKMIDNEGAKTLAVSNSNGETDQELTAEVDEDEVKNNPLRSDDADAISTQQESASKEETNVSKEDLVEEETSDDSAVLTSKETRERPPESSPASSNAATSPDSGAYTHLDTAEKGPDTFLGGNEPLSESIDNYNPWLVEPNDLESKEEEKSQEEPQKEVMAEEQTLTRISPVEEESMTKVEVTNKSSVHEEEPSVEQKVDSFEEFVTQVESEELPKKEVTTSVEHNPTDDMGSPNTSSAVLHDEDRHDDDLSVKKQKTNSFEEFVTQVESEERIKKEPLQDFVMVQEEEDVGSPQSANAVITYVHVTSVIRDPAESFSAPPIENSSGSSSDRASSIDRYASESPPLEPNMMFQGGSGQVVRNADDSALIENSSGSSSDRASSIDRYASESPPQEPNMMFQDGSGQVVRNADDPIPTSVSYVSEQAVLRPNAASYGGSNLGAHLSADAVSPKGIEEEDIASELEGGRLWFAAMRQANESSRPAPSTPNRRRLPETLMERTRSRADVDAFVTPRIPISPKDIYRSGSLVRLNDDDDLNLTQTAYAHKRVRVVQLLILGLIGLAFGFLGSFYVQSSCHFLTATVVVGGNEETFDLHYGMWKYTPLSSAFSGYSYCYKYDGQFTTDSPIIPRIVGISALLVGAYALAVLWVYLVLGRTDFDHWKRAIYAAGISAVFQALTLTFFAGSVCQRNRCSVGPGAAVSIVSTLTWFVLAFEMHYNTPITMGDEHDDGMNSPDGIVASLEMSDVEDGVTAFFRRVTNARGHDIPTLNQYVCRREKVVESPARRSYVPPPVQFGETV